MLNRTHPFWPAFFSIGGNGSFLLCPDSLLAGSGSGPCSVITLGEWQSSHPTAFTRYFPRASSSDCDGGAGGVGISYTSSDTTSFLFSEVHAAKRNVAPSTATTMGLFISIVV